MLHPAPLRDLLMRGAAADVMQARWSDAVLGEMVRSLARRRPDVGVAGFNRLRTAMERALPDARVDGYESLMRDLALPDPDDRHVLAAAVHAGAAVIVTFNLADFPAAALAPYGVAAQHPDAFVGHCLDVAPQTMRRLVSEQAGALRRPPLSVDAVLDALAALGLERSTSRLRALLAADPLRKGLPPTPAP